MKTNKIKAIILLISSIITVNALAQTNQDEKSNIELKSISPIEKTGYKKLKRSHWISHTEIIIDATPEQVWNVLCDTKSYPEWNQIIVKMDGRIVDKSSLDVLFKSGIDAKPKKFHHDTLHVEDGVVFYWSDVFAMGIKDKHSFRVQTTDDGKTKFIQADQAKGGATWLFGKTISKRVIELYPIFNKSLKAEVEKRYPKK